MKLSDAKLRAAKPGPKILKLSDGNGLQFWILPSGTRVWHRAYRIDGKQRDARLGEYPAMTLQEARAANLDIDRMLGAGRDPAAKRQAQKLAAAAARMNTFKAVSDDFCARAAWAPSTRKKNEHILGLAYADLGRRPISEIKGPEILVVARKIEARGHTSTALNLVPLVGQVFRHGIREGLATDDPTPALRGAIKSKQTVQRAAIVDRAGLGELLRAVDGYQGSDLTKIALLLLAHTFVRPGELRNARWKEFDLEAGLWTIPGGRMKARREFVVPLSRQAMALLRELHEKTGRFELILPGQRVAARPISENTLNAALRRLGYSKTEATSHGFRASASSLLRESGKWSRDVVEAALAHQVKDRAEAAYMRSPFLSERTKLMQWWSNLLDSLRDGGRVLPLSRPA